MQDRGSDSFAAWPRRVLAFALAGDAALTIAYVAAAFAGLAGSKAFKVIDLNLEANLPAWYASAKLLLVAVVFLALAVRPLASDARLAPVRRLSAVLAVLFAYLSADEGAGLHERISGLLGRVRFMPSIGGNGVWMFVYAALAVAGVVLARRQLVAMARLWPRELTLAVAGIGIMGAGGVLLEAVSYFWQPTAAFYPLEVAVEELLEMAGVSLVLYAAMRPLASAVAVLAEGVSGDRAGSDPQPRRASGTG